MTCSNTLESYILECVVFRYGYTLAPMRWNRWSRQEQDRARRNAIAIAMWMLSKFGCKQDRVAYLLFCSRTQVGKSIVNIDARRDCSSAWRMELDALYEAIFAEWAGQQKSICIATNNVVCS